ncbi:MAG: hypothetical protein GF353_07120 [Candidatus Lokiarchaeota archaeon]|nr:hypothetical protein [Candidatus Lokiarchaeota archaeon]
MDFGTKILKKMLREVQQMTVADYEELYERSLQRESVDYIDIDDHFKECSIQFSSNTNITYIDISVYEDPDLSYADNYDFNGLNNNNYSESDKIYLMAA